MKSLSIPFTLDGYGRVQSSQSLGKVYADRVRLALMTIPGERIMRPGFGSNVPEQSFESPEDIPEQVEVGVRDAFSSFLPGLVPEDISVTWEDVESGNVEIEITYRSETTQDSYSSSVNLNV